MKQRFHVAQYGQVWSLTAEAMQRFLENGAAGKEYNLDDYGKKVKMKDGEYRTFLHPLDVEVDGFKDLLKLWNEKKNWYFE